MEFDVDCGNGAVGIVSSLVLRLPNRVGRSGVRGMRYRAAALQRIFAADICTNQSSLSPSVCGCVCGDGQG